MKSRLQPGAWVIGAVVTVAAAGPVTALAQVPSVIPARIVNINECKSAYPKESTRAGEEGTTQVRLRVSAEGTLLDAQLTRSSGFERLDNATLSALSQCRYAPGSAAGVLTETSATISYRWRLEEAPAPRFDDCLQGIEYPPEAARNNQQGTTVMQVWFNAAHEIERMQVAQSSGSPHLDAAAAVALRRCKFKLLNQRPGAAPAEPTRIEYVWRLVDHVPAVPAVSPSPALPDPYRPL